MDEKRGKSGGRFSGGMRGIREKGRMWAMKDYVGKWGGRVCEG